MIPLWSLYALGAALTVTCVPLIQEKYKADGNKNKVHSKKATHEKSQVVSCIYDSNIKRVVQYVYDCYSAGMNKVHKWIIDHDDQLSFVLLYVGGAVLLSVFMNLFWVAMLMLAHLILEIWRHVVMQSRLPVLQALWCVKLDISILVFALVISLYSEHIFAMLGLGQAARAGETVSRGARVLTRFSIIERGLKVFFMTVDDMGRVVHMLIRRISMKRAMKAVKKDVEEEHEGGMDDGITKGDIFSLCFGVFCIIMILVSPYTVTGSYRATFERIIQELQP